MPTPLPISPWRRAPGHDHARQHSYAYDNADRLRKAVASATRLGAHELHVWFRCASWTEIESLAVQVCRAYQNKRRNHHGNPWRTRRFKFELLPPA